MDLLIRGGRVIDPAGGIDDLLDVLIADDRISRLGKNLSERSPDTQIIQASGMVVAPGLIDLHAHLREPGYEHKETLQTGLEAAVVGGFTSVACMPNTDPVNDNPAVTHYLISRARQVGKARLLPIGAITQGLGGGRLAEIGEQRKAGTVAISDDGRPVMNSEVMRRALEYAGMFGMPVISHCEDLNLSGGGVMHEGWVSTELGLKGYPTAAEEVMVSRDLTLAELTGSRLHIAHVSCAGSVHLIRQAKEKGIRVTAEVTPHHFTLTDEAVRGFDPNTKVNPPLRSAEDIRAIEEGLKDGTIEVIATDHAPHDLAEKDLEYAQAAFGMVGLETALGLALDRLYHRGILSLPQLLAKLTLNPARALNLDAGKMTVGAQADVVILDPERHWRVDGNAFRSKGRNSPFHGWQLRGMAMMTIVGGQIVMDQGLGIK